MRHLYLLIAEQILFRNNKLSAINIWDHFSALHLPAKFDFDLAFICGPGWEAGEYDLNFKIKANHDEIVELGAIKATIPNDKSIFNAIASNLNFIVEKNTTSIIFIIEANGVEVLTKEYPVSYILELQNQEEQTATV